MAVVNGTIHDNGGAICNVRHPDYGAVGDGTTDDTAAIQAAIDQLASTGGEVFFPPGRYRITSALTLHPVSGSYAAITLRGTSWSFGASPATNAGSVIEYAGSSGSAFLLGPTTATGSPLYNLTMVDLAVQATSSSYTGNLVDLRAAGKCSFENCGFSGLPLATSATASALVYGNFWVDTHFSRCQFLTAVTGVKKAALGGGWEDSVNAVSFERCIFARCGTPADIQGNVAEVWFERCTFEPAINWSAAAVILSGNPGGGVRGSWFGDSNGSGTWLKLGGVGAIVSGNLFAGADVGVELLATAYAVEIEGNYFMGCDTAVKAVSNGLRMRGNFIYLPDNGIALDLSNDPAAAVEYNRILNTNGAGHGTVGYKLAAGTGGVLADLVGSGPDTLVQNGAGEAWSILQGQTATYQKATHLAAGLDLEVQGYLRMTGSVGSPAFTTRFISDAGSGDTFFHNVPGSGSHQFAEAGVALLKLQKAGAVDDDTAAILLRRQSGTWTAVRVSEGAANSGGTGYRVLRVPN